MIVRSPTARWLPALVLGVAACAAPVSEEQDAEDEAPLPVILVETRRELALVGSPDEGLARSVRVIPSIAPLEPLPLLVVGERPEGQAGNDALLQVQLRWTDFIGVTPVSFSRTTTEFLPFGPDGVARRDAPLERALHVDLEPPLEAVLARRVEATVRLHPVDLVLEEAGRSGGASLDYPPAVLDTLVPLEGPGFEDAPPPTLAELLAAEEPAEPRALFLVAAEEALGDRQGVLTRLVEALPTLRGPLQEAVFGTLQYLTGETRGRSVYRWQAWLEQQETGSDP